MVQAMRLVEEETLTVCEGVGFDSRVRLGEWQEAIGVLVDVDRDAGVIAYRSLKVIVPPRELEHLPDLEAFTGHRVGILRTDLSTKPLLIRLAEEPEEDNR